MEVISLAGIDQEELKRSPPAGFYSEDPTDLLNSLLTLPIDLPGVQVRLPSNSILNMAHATDLPCGDPLLDLLSRNLLQKYQQSVLGGSAVGAAPGPGFQYKGEAHTGRVIASISNRVPMDEQLKKLSRLVPHVDAVVFACILGRPDKTMEVTTHR